MLLARIDGTVVTSIGHPSLKGQRIVLCTPVGAGGEATGAPFAAIDTLGAGLHQQVVITTDGSWTQATVHDDTSPVRNQVVGLVDPERSDDEAR